MNALLSNQMLVLLFLLGHLAIIFEFHAKVNKKLVALLMAVLCYGLYFVADSKPVYFNIEEFPNHLRDISQIFIFLLGVMTLVEKSSYLESYKKITKS